MLKLVGGNFVSVDEFKNVGGSPVKKGVEGDEDNNEEKLK